jgi:UDP-N-acetylglucosamine kinase
MVQNQHQETPEFKAIQQKMESLQPTYTTNTQNT